MAVIQSAGSVTDVQRPWFPTSSMSHGVALYEGVYQDYAAIWRTQPNVRTVVGFLARNIAQLGLHVFDRVSDDERRRITEGTAGAWLRRPTPSKRISLYDLINWFVHDLCVFDNAYWAKVKAPSSGAVATVPLLPQQVEPLGGGLLDPDTYRLHGSRGHRDLEPDQVVHVHGYNPEDRRHGVSPMETLRRIIAEDLAAGRYRERFWLNSTRVEGILQRPQDRKPLSDQARARLKADWQAAYAGGSESGGTPLLEEGMTFEPTSFSAKDSEYIAARKLTREEVAAAFYVHPAMVGILERATFANIQEQHRMTYQDTLGPVLRQLEGAFALQLADELALPSTAYFEFNIHEKLRGSFEEEAKAMQTAVGAPHMTRNEARARRNLPPVEGGDLLVTPLNVIVGGQASPTDSGSQNVRSVVRAAKALGPEAAEQQQIHRRLFERFFERQQAAVLARVGGEKSRGAKASLAEVFDRQRWDDELAADLLRGALSAAQASGEQVVELFGGEWDVTEVAGLYEALEESSRAMAEEINDWTAGQLADALADDEDPVAASREVFTGLVTARAGVYAASRTNTVWNFSRGVAAKASGASQKQWRVTSGNPRSAHAALDGETVAIGETFSNGAQWPGDPVLPVEERANCECTFDVLTEATA